ncbi:replicative DNA helicase [Ornithinimicrobium sufpigmenti]|uniref:replicative DNA helicase n=1 Tax=Ornithinimicrobium sufpigmenti TaxID=2508882 RepID=UPI0010358063|nr:MULTISPECIES: replicative DNA helicase [unclassified Ornithinimicrobium]
MTAALHHLHDQDDAPVDDPTLTAEQAVLGSILISPAALADVTEQLTPEHFHQPRHEHIYTAALHLASAGQAVDPITVADHLRTTGSLARAGGQAYLHHLVTVVTTPANAAWHATIIRNAHTLRTIAAVGRELATTQETPTSTEDALDQVDTARARLDALVTDQTTTTPHPVAVQQALDSLTEEPGTPTPWTRLTHAIAGWKPGELVIIGARPSTGKTAMSGDIVLDAARRHHHPVMFSLEMPTTQLHLRMLSNIGSVDGGRIQRRRLTADDWEALENAKDHLASLPMTIDDRPGLSLAQIRAKVRALKRTTPDVGPVIVDYLGLITPPSGAPRNDRRVQVDAIARGLKNLAKELDIPVIALAQINRGPEARVDKKPQMSDLRESGEIENAADTVILLHRDLTGETDPSELHVAIPKNRHLGPTQLDLTFVGHYSRITEDPRPWRPANLPPSPAHWADDRED